MYLLNLSHRVLSNWSADCAYIVVLQKKWVSKELKGWIVKNAAEYYFRNMKYGSHSDHRNMESTLVDASHPHVCNVGQG